MKPIVVNADITTLTVDVIINAANSSLLGGGGVDGAIHRKAGPSLLEECLKIRARQGGCNTGEAVITNAGNLACKKVIHTVGPVWNGDKKEKDQLLQLCYTNSLQLAFDNKLKTVAFPNISTGIYHFPKERAAQIAINAVKTFEHISFFDSILFACFDKENFDIYEELLNNG